MADDVATSLANLVRVPFTEAVRMGERIGARVRDLVEDCDCDDDLPIPPSGDVSAMLREAEDYTRGGTS